MALLLALLRSGVISRPRLPSLVRAFVSLPLLGGRSSSRTAVLSVHVSADTVADDAETAY